jgi:oligopeptide transport system permease protein
VLLFTARRLGQAVLAVFVTTFLMYVGLIQFGDPFLTSSGSEKPLPPETKAALHAYFGLDRPVYVQYLSYLRHIFTGNFGIDFHARRPVAELLGPAASNTARLALLAIAIDIVIGVFAGILAAMWRDSFVDAFINITAVVVLCIPSFVTASFLSAHVAGLHIFGAQPFPPVPHPFGMEVPWYREILLPAFSLALLDIAFVARLMRTSMLEVLHADYLRTARAKGLPERTIVFKHAMRNALIPVVNHLGITIGIFMGGAVIVEAIFDFNGLGGLILEALAEHNNPVLLATAVLAVVAFVTASAVVDILCARFDPRIRIG